MSVSSSDKVMQMVEKLLKKNPGISNAELFKRAKEINSKIGQMTLRQFHAKYPLQVKRRSAPARSKRAQARARRSPTGANAADREAVRRALISFAKDVAAAEGKTGTIDLLSDLDRYVTLVIKAATGKK
ncbi:MAG: hypothetical protein ACE5HQ_04300 [Gemmatimonadota bacterium]